MKANVDSWTGAGVIALDRSELQETRGGLPLFWIGVLGSALVVMLDGADDFVEAVKEGYAWARS